ncbi:replication factor A protein 3 [Linnemannia elongata]|uniref:Replication factor A protein 3 n=1 Tax=Linnemannia elongata AG-77 TaxID=1314771 RepID=A0A197JHU3_9FUNG|nr:hypothetical protein BGZ88_003183 [Linnemannia elongata]OAQ24071.1 replication factor A protein 3 [Linnemannia elongata AG-77]KAF9340878.1 hypothetical protein BGZ91_012059 [Linnemannia elongata]KAG0062568.1 hypothetical protein BGZ89_010557 [Linnemannia elongata]KAG0072369.1 hypothetical protein BGZ90_011936 [Linnemannia elongata]
MSLPTTKRVNSAMLQNCIGETVRFVGEFKSRQHPVATFLASDKGSVTVVMNDTSQYGTKFVEVIGTVNPDRSITEMISTNFGDDFNMETYDAMVRKAQKFPSVF